MNRHFKGKSDIKRFCKWLSSAGAEVLTPSHPWELVRFSGNGITSMIYRRKNGDCTFAGEAYKALELYKTGRHMRFCAATKLNASGDFIHKTIRARDGDGCFFCGDSFTDDRPATIEHLVSRTHSGPNHISNKFLAHEDCNTRAGSISAPEKIALRDALRARRQVIR